MGTHFTAMSVLKPGYTLLLLILVPQLIWTQSMWFVCFTPLACGFSSKKHGYYCSYEKNTDKCREYLSCYITASGDCATRDVPEARVSTSTMTTQTETESTTTALIDDQSRILVI